MEMLKVLLTMDYFIFPSSSSVSGMKTPLGPSQLLGPGQIFAFGAMCQELMEPPTPTPLGVPVQQAPSPGDR